MLDWFRKLLSTPHHSSIRFRRGKKTPGQDPLQEYYDELETPQQHMRELRRRNIALMSEMNGG